MSEFINTHENRTGFRWKLLATASAIALVGSAYGASEAHAADSDNPPLWIELGGQLSRLDDGQEAFAPSLMAARPSILSPSQKFEGLPRYSIDETGKISFEPDSSGWVFSASVLYGRSSSNKHVRQQTNPKVPSLYVSGKRYAKYPNASKFADTSTQTNEHHLILDFQAGKDVGLGMFGGRDGSSVLNLGVRFAQFSSRSNIALKSDPDWHFTYRYISPFGSLPFQQVYHSNAAAIQATRSFHGLGPSISWNASAPLMGNPQNSELTLDWGVNAAILFGRNRTTVQHQTTARYHSKSNFSNYHTSKLHTQYRHSTDHTRTKSIIVPNVGGFAGLSFCYSNAKVSFGYRADFFFGAMDGGIDAAHRENVGFYGPFASVSVGLP